MHLVNIVEFECSVHKICPPLHSSAAMRIPSPSTRLHKIDSAKSFCPKTRRTNARMYQHRRPIPSVHVSQALLISSTLYTLLQIVCTRLARVLLAPDQVAAADCYHRLRRHREWDR